MDFAVFHIQLINDLADFSAWKRQMGFEEFRQMADDFFRTRDIRRSRLAQQLVDREDLNSRAQRARALFKWADKNRDGKLTLEEFKHALPEPE